jgi:polar amino acid transport system substrate-binding protein
MLPKSIQQSGELNIGTSADSIPCEYMQSGKMVGVGVDFWDAVAQKLGVKVHALSVTFDDLIPGVQSGRFDIAEQCISDNLPREKVVSFVDYPKIATVLVAPKNAASITSDPSTLCGKSIAALSGSNYIDFVTDNLDHYCTTRKKPALKLTQLPDQGSVLTAVESGRADMGMTNSTAAAFMSKASLQKLKTVSESPLPVTYVGFVVQKGATQLQQALLAAFKKIHASKEYDTILKKWRLSPKTAGMTPAINIVGAQARG